MNTQIVLPNVRKLFIPDPGYVLYEADLAGADAQVVAWEAEDDDLKEAFRAGIDVHSKNASDMLGAAFERLVGHARKSARQANKKAVHATNYGASARTVAISLGWTVAEAERFQRRWFDLHPGIRDNFQGKIRAALQQNRTVTNPFGFRRVFFGRIENSFAEALAWVPQSTVALNTYHGAFQLEEAIPEAEILLQVHDSLVFQLPSTLRVDPAKIRETLRVKTPYPDPLYIPWGLAKSERSWGEMTKVDEG